MEIIDDREKMPEFDESIFYPEVAAMALGLSLEDLSDITEYVRWLYRQKELHEKRPRERLIQLLRTRQNQLIEHRRLELLHELRRLEKLSPKF